MRIASCTLTLAVAIVLLPSMAPTKAAPFVTAPRVEQASDVHLVQGRWRGRDVDDEYVEDYLRDLGYYDVDVDESRRGFRANGCRDGRYYRFRVTFDGEIVDRERVGRCDDDRHVSVDVPGVDLDVDRRDGDVLLRVPGLNLRVP